MNNCDYNKIKVLHEISKISGFIEKFCADDAQKAGHECHKVLNELHQSLEEHAQKLKKEIAKH